jgi:hypothetical protein
MISERGNKHDSVLRRFKRQVLDAHHRSLPLLRRPPGVALYGLMAAYDSSLLPIAAVTPHITPEAIGSMQRLKYIYESVNPATRWIVSGNLIPDPVLAPNRALIEEGGELLSYARDYVQVAIFHVMYGHDLVTAETDENKRVVRFIPPDGSSFPYGFAESTLGQTANDTRDAERAEAVKAAKPLIEGLPYSLDRGHIHPASLREIEQLLESEPGSVKFQLNFGYDRHRANVAKLRAAYLLMFKYFGYEYILHKNVEGVRQQILTPGQDLIASKASFAFGLAPEELNSIALLRHSPELRCFVVSFRVSTAVDRSFGVILPGLGDGGDDVYERWHERRETLKGVQMDATFVLQNPNAPPGYIYKGAITSAWDTLQ